MNSIIQCVSNTPPLRNFFITGQYKMEINKSNPLGQQGKLAHEFARLLTDIWSGEYVVVAPRSGWQQHDSQEFLGYVLDGLHEDLNLVKSKPYTEKIESNGRPDIEVANLSWQLHLMRNRSKIVDLFQVL
ncbi:ubiquitin specific peptidase 4 (proto-oncogene) [Reticulomyxa filosa]|uniref:Ubiquitin specific peptidase 4 (Proto-oncogene) n=1 Tax=Reticulomyxa filosa TaxID=46433 RepID=X6MQX7_RETFI|nr:ubiquitin specific peptidase 4 (proto-oncogene) [Reticulomyxa filosa]|eukprot:ETO16368.1 ubiquitin specific peptidase 4 (proto-oncogene) [Reticulomyxa filosa]